MPTNTLSPQSNHQRSKGLTPLQKAANIPDSIKRKYQKKLISWFQKNRRNFVWRNTTHPYEVLVAELLLQKTHSRKVQDVYQSFLRRYPSFKEVADAPVKEIESEVSLLGLKYRAIRIKQISTAVIERYNGNLPDKFEELIKLKGIGDYIASAVLLFGFGQAYALLDSNVIRVLSRVFDIKSPKKRPHTDKELLWAAQILQPKKQFREYNLAVLDLAAIICKPVPDCPNCPIAKLCNYYIHSHAK